MGVTGAARGVGRGVFSLPGEPVDAAGDLAATYLRSHRGVDTTDYVIAATTLAVGGALWTRNRKHFPMFENLPDPYAASAE